MCEDWELKYFVIEKDGKAQCLLCHAMLKGMKAFNIERH